MTALLSSVASCAMRLSLTVVGLQVRKAGQPANAALHPSSNGANRAAAHTAEGALVALRYVSQ